MWTRMVGLSWCLMACVIACMSWGVSNAAQSAPPLLTIAAGPLASTCRFDGTGQLDGPALVRTPAKPD